MRLIKKIRSLILDSSRKINERVFIVLVMVAMGMLFIALVGDVLYNNAVSEIITIIFLMILAPTVTAIGIKYNKIDAISKMVSIILMIVVPIIFFSVGGAEGPAILWFIFYYIYIGLVLTGLWRVVNLVILTILVIVLFILQYYHPELVHEQKRWIFYLDTSLAVIEIGFVCFIMTWYQNSLFNLENKKAREETRKVEEMSKSQTRFFSSMSHEIRTPINSILGLNEIILRQKDASDEIIKDAGNIQGAGRMLLALVNDILDFSKIEAGKMDIVPGNYSLSQMISEIVNMIWLRAEQKGLEFRVEIDPTIPAELFGDEVRIKQILINLLNNAIKYTAEGSVTLHIEKEEIKDDMILLMYSVIDTGLGIKQDVIPYLFDAFERFDEEKTTGIEGTGLGLSIVKQLVELMDGRVTVNSVYTQGSTFVVTLWQKITGYDPIGELSIEGINTSDNNSYEVGFTTKDVSILIVDDNEMNLEVEKKLLSGTGIDVDIVTGGEEALVRTLSVRYDLILMDHLMPGMDGIECMQLIRKQSGGLNNHVPIIVLTANAGSENRELYVNSGFDGYLVKPISGHQLEEALFRHIPETKIVKNNSMSTGFAHMNTIGSYNRKIPVLVTTSSSCDIPLSVIRDHQIDIISYRVNLDGRVYNDMMESGPDELLRYLHRGVSFSVESPSAEELESFFGKELKKAHNIIYIAVSSKLNNEYENAIKAAGTYGNVTVFDSGLMSSSVGLLVLVANRMSLQGKTPDKIIEELSNIRDRIKCSLVSNAVYFRMGNSAFYRSLYSFIRMLYIRPFITMKEGRYTVRRLSIGDDRKRCQDRYIDYALPKRDDPDSDILVVTHAGLSEEDMDRIEKRIRRRHDFKNIFFIKGSAPFVLSCGAGSFGLTYFSGGETGLNISSMLQRPDEPDDNDEDNEIHDTEINTVDKREDVSDKWYGTIPGINAENALRNSGSEDTLTDMFRVFYESIEAKSSELNTYFDKEDWNNYTVKVHALKSSARLVGADDLADRAQKLEDAGKNGDNKYITENHAEFMADYMEFKDLLKGHFEPESNDEDKQIADPEVIKAAYEEIREAAAEMDYDRIEGVFEEMKDYSMPESEKDKWDDIKEAALQFDYETLIELLKD